MVLEGPDKSGKSTQAALLVSAIKRLGRAVIHTREPGGTSFAEAVRQVVLNPEHRVAPLAELLLYEAARAQHTVEKLQPALKAGRVVISERYTLATLAYQGFGRRLPLPLVRRLNAIATFGVKPDLTIVLDIPERQFADRDKGRVHDRLERESAAFRSRVRAGYRRLARSERGVCVINGRKAVDEIHAEILARVKRLL